MVKHPTNFTKEEFEKEQFARRFYFAKFCAKHGGKWKRVFQEKEGMTLQEFKRQVDEIKKQKR